MTTIKVGLVAGRGELPLEVINEIHARGGIAVVAGLKPEASPELEKQADLFAACDPGELDAILTFFQGAGVTEVVFAGKVGKEAIFRGRFDPKLKQLLAALSVKNDDAILATVVKEFERNGLPVARQTDYLRRLIAGPEFNRGEPSPAEIVDLHYGFRLAKAIGGLDIGQSVVIKQGVALAVEAMEGTDQAIIRGGKLGGAGVAVVKVSKPSQDERFDVPTVGVATLEAMNEVKASVLGIEAGKTLLVGGHEFLDLAGAYNIKIIVLSENDCKMR